VLADLDMPDMGGLALLQEVMARYPALIRIILFGEGERDRALGCLGWAHQFLAKPLDPGYLHGILQAISATAGQVPNLHVRELVTRIGQLPAVPHLYQEVTALLESDHGTTEMVGQIIAKDIAMTAMLLKLANSAYFNLRAPVSSAASATSYLGVELVKALVLAHGLFGQVGAFRIPTFSINHLWAHSLAVATTAKKITELAGVEAQGMRGDEAFTAGLLHDIGLLVLASRFPEDYLAVVELTRTGGGDVEAAERQIFGAAHGPVGAHLLALWGLPAPLIDAAANHHTPSLQAVPGFTPTLAVHLADAFVAEHAEHELFATAHLDLDCLGAMGMMDRLPLWRAAALPG
jgi:putative nucleotidyltransferase with HDIG domain